MRKLVVFNHVTLDGYFTDCNGDMSWAHSGDDAELNAFVAENASGEGQLLFGRITYELMASYLLADAKCDEKRSCRGRRHESYAEGSVL